MARISHAREMQDASVYGTSGRVTVRDIAKAKERGHRWAMLTAYDAMTGAAFDEAGIPVILVGDTMGNNHLGYDSTVPVSLDEIALLAAAVVRGTERALVIGDLPFGSYQQGPEQALKSALRLVKEAGVGAVKLEGGERSASQISAIVSAGIPVMGHVGLTPQSVNAFGGYPVQGRGDTAARRLLRDARAVQDAGAFGVVLEAVPGELASQVTDVLAIPTIGIGAGPECDAQVLVWTDALGVTPGRLPRFVKRYADVRQTMVEAARAYAEEVADGAFPAPEHVYR
ncbi:3-methyl-2-oxobutanoate hydroxymethyltransferase [Actinomadura decatromicini]|uniref:3-methyl-2-oxobutanoate hydroxymethyltransferase n=1 Tax=Actinomadura decatromicini TaxID=2604572 RepID=A0A5D3FDZ1_9ACTN|nr:3-methyl-2-oxobutanoate hydroxymethyltransferase [Actinomadura decatromicini]TYK47107.1 3-methyl-2-oxobutanoate hydroxymethyltransferase [Actinomadura decatromicini]